jgi:hypothetical protein
LQEGGLDINYDDFFDPIDEGFDVGKTDGHKTGSDTGNAR